MAISGRLILAALLGLGLAGFAASAMLGYVGLLALLVIADLALAGRIRDLRVTRQPIGSVRLGATTAAVLSFDNEGRRTLRADVRDAWAPSAGIRPYRQRIRVRAGDRRRTEWTLAPTRRGRREASEVAVRSYGPLGLAGRQRRITVPGSVDVLPPFTSRKFLPEKLSRLRQIEGAVLVRQRGRGSEFDSLREYVLGDDVRSIDWRASARSRDLVVRTWRPERDRHIVIAIDTGRSSAARIQDEPRLDSSIDAALLLGAVAARAGDRVAVLAADVKVRARLGLTASSQVLPRLVTALTPLQAELVETDPQLLAGEVGRLTSTRSLIVLFTSLDAAAAGAELRASVAAIAGRHQVLIASVTDPRVDELARDRDGTDAVYAAAAAEAAGLRRAAAAEQLHRLGARVVEAGPATFASAVTDAYLDLKAAGRL